MAQKRLQVWIMRIALIEKNSQSTENKIHTTGVACDTFDEQGKVPYGQSKATGHLIFNVNIDFAHNDQWVLYGHKTSSRIGSRHTRVASRESVRMYFAHFVLNVIEFFTADIRNSYLQAPSSEKHHTTCGTEFGLESVGKNH